MYINAFNVQVQAPEVALMGVLDQDARWESGMTLHAGWNLELGALPERVRA